MKTLSEIIEAVKDGEKPDYEDLRYGLLALASLHYFLFHDMLKVYEKSTDDTPFGLKWLAEESFNRSKRVMGFVPKQYIGDTHDSDNPAYQKERQSMRRLADKIIGNE